MATAVQVEQAAEEEVVVEKAVPNPLVANKQLKRDLELLEPRLQKRHKLFTCILPHAGDPADEVPKRQKLFLHRSVSRTKPNSEQLQKWMQALYAAPALFLPSSECIITLIQPKTARPGRRFLDPESNSDTYIGYASAVLLHHGEHPTREHDEASHLCGHGRCVNEQHLLWESMSVNFSRNECHRYGVACSHMPPCIPLNVDDLTRVRNALAQQIKNKTLTKYFCKGCKWTLDRTLCNIHTFTKYCLTPLARC